MRLKTIVRFGIRLIEEYRCETSESAGRMDFTRGMENRTGLARRPFRYLLLGVLLISFSPILVKLSGAPSLQVGFYRNAFGLFFLLLLVLIKKEKWYADKWSVLLPFLAGVLFFVDLWGWHSAIGFVGPGIATLLGNFQVFFLTFFGIVLFKETVSYRFLLSVPLALFGVYMIVSADSKIGEKYFTGVALALGAAACYSGFLLILKKTQSMPKKVTAEMNLLYVTAFTGLFFAVAMVGAGTSFRLASNQALGALLAYGFVPHVLGWIIISRCLPLVKTSVAGITLLLQPVLSFLWEVLIFHKQFEAVQLVGGLVAVIAIYLGTRGQQKVKETK